MSHVPFMIYGTGRRSHASVVTFGTSNNTDPIRKVPFNISYTPISIKI